MSGTSPDAARVTLRRLRPADPDLDEVVDQLNRAENWDDFEDQFSVASLRRFLERDDRLYLLAYSNSTLAGAAHAYLLPHPAGHTVAYIDEVDTAKTFRRQGIATALMKELLLWAQGRGAKEAWLATEDENEPAKALYKKLTPVEEALSCFFTYRTESPRNRRPQPPA